MQKIILTLAAMLTAMLFSGCAGPEQKLGRGFSNAYDPARLGEMQRSIEQSCVWDADRGGFFTGVIHGFDQTVARTGLGLWEVATFPLPPYQITSTGIPGVAPYPVYPESYKPGRFSDSIFDTTAYAGFPGGDVAPFVPGSRFSVFGN